MERSNNINTIQEDSANYQRSCENQLLAIRTQEPFPASHAAPSTNIPHMDWNPGTMLDNLTFIEEKIRQLKSVIRSMVRIGGQSWIEPGELNAELTGLMVEIVSTAGSLLPTLNKSSFLSHYPAAAAAAGTGNMAANLAGASSSWDPNAAVPKPEDDHHCMEEMQSPDNEEFLQGLADDVAVDKDHDGSESGEAGMDGGDSLPPGSYELLQLEKDDILAPHTHLCAICGKGFKRDANLRMHMRGHGDEYKSPGALVKPPIDAATAAVKRYSCPFPGCKRNMLHTTFLPLKTILSLKNHYKRSHCEKSHTCSRCHSKKFSIMSDLRTHEKHCGQVQWLCSCGTTFSRKEKLLAHVGLFKGQGHTPSFPADDEPPEASDQVITNAPASQREPDMGSSFMRDCCSGNGDDDPSGVDDLGGDFLSSTTNFVSLGFGLGQFDGFPHGHSQY